MGRDVRGLTVDRLADLPGPCGTCVRWELDAVSAQRTDGGADATAAKEAWVAAALLDWGSIGRIAYLDDRPVGYLMYAPPGLVPRATAFPTAPVSPDAVLLMGARVVESARGQGIGRLLVQAMAKDALRRGVRAVEAFGAAGILGTPAADGGCLVPAEFYTAVGFKTVREHQRCPRLRLDLRTVLTWREDVEHAVERLLAQVRSPVLTPTRRV